MAVTVPYGEAVRCILGPEHGPTGKRALTDEEKQRFTHILDMATAAVNHYIDSGSGSTAPEAVVQGAIIRACYYDWHSRMVGDSRGAAGGNWLRPALGARSPLRASGAEAILQPYKRRRAGICR